MLQYCYLQIFRRARVLAPAAGVLLHLQGCQQLVDHQATQPRGPGRGGAAGQHQARRGHPAGARPHPPRPQLPRRGRARVAAQPGDQLLHRLQHLHGRAEPLAGRHHQQGHGRGGRQKCKIKSLIFHPNKKIIKNRYKLNI